MDTAVRLGVLGGSIVAAVTGFVFLRLALGRRDEEVVEPDPPNAASKRAQ